MVLDTVLGELHEGLLERRRLRRQQVEHDGEARRARRWSPRRFRARERAVVFEDGRGASTLEGFLQSGDLRRANPDEALRALRQEFVDRDLSRSGGPCR